MQSDFVTVLDIGSSTVRCLAARPSGDDLEIIASGTAPSAGLARGRIANTRNAAKAIDEALRKVENGVGIKIDRLVVGVGGPAVEGTNSNGLLPIFPPGRRVSRADVLQVLNHSRQVPMPDRHEQIQVLPRQFKVDNLDAGSDPIDRPGKKLTVSTYVVSAELEQLELFDEAVRGAGAEIDMLVLNSLAGGLGVLSPQEMLDGCAVIDLGAASTSVAIFSGGSIVFSGCVPLGWNSVTSDLSKLLKATLEDAEELKVRDGVAWSDSVAGDETVLIQQLGANQPRPIQKHMMAEIIEYRVREIAALCRARIESSGVWAEVKSIALTGGGSRLQGTKAVFDSVMIDIPCWPATPKFSGLAGQPEMAAAVGLARFALSLAEDELAPVDGGSGWKDRVRSFWSQLSR